MKATIYGDETGSFEYDKTERKWKSETERINGLDYNKTTVNANGCHINFWIEKGMTSSVRREVLKRAYQEATRLFDVVSYGYSYIPVIGRG